MNLGSTSELKVNVPFFIDDINQVFFFALTPVGPITAEIEDESRITSCSPTIEAFQLDEGEAIEFKLIKNDDDNVDSDVDSNAEDNQVMFIFLWIGIFSTAVGVGLLTLAVRIHRLQLK